MNMGSLFGTILQTILKHKEGPLCTVKDPLQASIDSSPHEGEYWKANCKSTGIWEFVGRYENMGGGFGNLSGPLAYLDIAEGA